MRLASQHDAYSCWALLCLVWFAIVYGQYCLVQLFPIGVSPCLSVLLLFGVACVDGSLACLVCYYDFINCRSTFSCLYQYYLNLNRHCSIVIIIFAVIFTSSFATGIIVAISINIIAIIIIISSMTLFSYNGLCRVSYD